ncbi:MAG: serine/threonine-protein kinase [Kofleriaceae bacterium]
MERCPEPDAWFVVDADDQGLFTHLDRCAECRSVAAAIARADVLDAPPRDDDASEGLVPELLPHGARLGRYVVRGTIGAGGMGVVLEAHDPTLDRTVALKIVRRLRDDAGWARAKARVLAEAQAMARLAHPNVVAIHDLIELGDEHLIAMEHVDGPDLDAWLATAPAARERRRVLVEAARGLAAAHDAGVVHRDVKPSNIMVGADGRARVTDFGLAALAGEPTRGALGTPGFVAPEVAAGGAFDARTDQYAFAVTAWRALFDAEPGAHGRGPTARVLARALATDPAARWPSMDALGDALAGAHRGARWRWGVGVGVVAAAAVGAGLWLADRRAPTTCRVDEAAISAVWAPARRAQWVADMRAVVGAAADTIAADVDRAWAQWREASLAACGAPVQVTDCLATTRRQLTAYVRHAPASPHTSAAEAALANIAPAAQCLQAPEARPFATSPALAAARAPYRDGLDEVATLSWLGQYAAALALLDQLLATAPADDPALRGALLYRKADQLARTGDVAGSVPVLEEALGIAERAGNDVARLNTMILLLSAYEELGQTDRANALATVAEAAAQRVPRDPAVAARLATVLGSLAYDAGGHAAAERHYQDVVALQQELHGPSDPEVAGALHNLGLAVHQAGRSADAVALQERALAMFEATVGPAHPDTALPVTELAGLALEQGRLADAERLYRRGLAIREAALGADHPHLGETLVGLGRALAQLGEPADAVAAFRRGCRLARQLGDQHPLLAACEYWLADTLAASGARAEALALLEHAAAAWDASGVASPDAAFTRFALAQHRWRAGAKAEARALARRAHAQLVELAAPYATEATEVEAWLATH